MSHWWGEEFVCFVRALRLFAGAYRSETSRTVRDDVNDTREVVSEPTDEVTCSYPCTLCHFGRDFGVDHKCHARLGQRGCLLGLFLCQSAVGGELGKYSARESIRASARGPILHTRGNFS